MALCSYLEANHKHVRLLDKAVLELGAGTGLVSIVSCLMGEWGKDPLKIMWKNFEHRFKSNNRINISCTIHWKIKWTQKAAPRMIYIHLKWSSENQLLMKAFLNCIVSRCMGDSHRSTWHRGQSEFQSLTEHTGPLQVHTSGGAADLGGRPGPEFSQFYL